MRLEDEEERHQAAEAERLERLAQVEVTAAAAWQGGAELRVDEAVGEGEDEPGDPRVDQVRTVHRRHHERDGEERPHAHHADHVGGGGLEQAHAAIEVRGLGRLEVPELADSSPSSASTSRSACSRELTSGLRASASTSSRAVTGERGADGGALVRFHPRDQVARVVGHRRHGLRARPLRIDTAGHLDDVLGVEERAACPGWRRPAG